MSISFESAVATLKTMFPDWDEDTLSTILVSNNYHVENTIETVLSMGDTTGEMSPSNQRPISPPTTIPTPAPSRHQQAPPQSAPQRAAAPSYQTNENIPPPSSSASARNRNRGLHCELPPDFLRPPSWQPSSNTILADEELALMLQDELFQQQARDMLGDNFMNEAYGPNRAPGQANNLRGGRYGGQNQQQGQAYPPAPQPDLGILKALSSMGAAAKRNLTQLAQGFNSTGNNSNSNGDNSNTGGSGTRSNRNSGEGNPSYVSRGGFGGGSPPTGRAAPKSHSTRKKGAFNDLEDDEEGTEIITFSSSQGGDRSRHMLQDDTHGAVKNNNDDADAGEEDGLLAGNENPLLQYRTNNVNIPRKKDV